MTHDSKCLRIYSIGADGVDDHGLGRWEDPAACAKKDDSAFRLLDPSKRNREPEPKPKPEPVTTEDGPANMFE